MALTAGMSTDARGKAGLVGRTWGTGVRKHTTAGCGVAMELATATTCHSHRPSSACRIALALPRQLRTALPPAFRAPPTRRQPEVPGVTGSSASCPAGSLVPASCRACSLCTTGLLSVAGAACTACSMTTSGAGPGAGSSAHHPAGHYCGVAGPDDVYSCALGRCSTDGRVHDALHAAVGSRWRDSAMPRVHDAPPCVRFLDTALATGAWRAC